MRKHFIRLLCVSLLVAGLYSCGSKTVETESFYFEQKYYLTQDTSKGVLSVEMQVELPYKYKDSNVLKIVRNDIVNNIFGDEYIEIANKDILQRFASDMYEEYTINNLPFLKDEAPENIGYAFNNDYYLESFSLLSDEHIFSYGINLYVYMGGAHGLGTRMYRNYNLKDGSIIAEDDLFTGDYKTYLTGLMMQHIIADSEEINSMEELKEVYWTEHIMPNGNFFLTSESINYVFNPYDIAPYAWGRTEVNIPFAEIRPILKPGSPICYLIDCNQCCKTQKDNCCKSGEANNCPNANIKTCCGEKQAAGCAPENCTKPCK